MFEGVADLGGKVDGVGVGGRVIGLRVGCGNQQEGEKKTEWFYAAFYDSSPGLVYKALRYLMPLGQIPIERTRLR